MPSSFYGPKIESIADGGGSIELDVPQGGTLWHVGVSPVDASVPKTSVLADLVKVGSDAPFRTQVLPLGVASSDAAFTHSHFRTAEMKLPDDERLIIRARIFNLTGAAVNWQLVAIVEVEELE